MRAFLFWAMVMPAISWATLPDPGMPGSPKDSRYCGEPARNADGTIKRSWTQRQRFISVWPKPDRPGDWYVDHILPLKQGGCDLPHNMQWLNGETKTCAGWCKDRWEQEVYNPERAGDVN